MHDRSDSIGALAAALAKAQGAISNATKNKQNPHFRSNYADLSAVLDVIREPMAANELSVIHHTEAFEGKLLMTTTLMHSSGEWVQTQYVATPKDGGPQAVGSVSTYLRRYSLSSMFAVTQQDDDGNAGQRGSNNSHPQAASRQPPQQARQQGRPRGER